MYNVLRSGANHTKCEGLGTNEVSPEVSPLDQQILSLFP